MLFTDCISVLTTDTVGGGDKELASTWQPFQHIRRDKLNLHYETRIPGATPAPHITFPHTSGGQELEPIRSNQYYHRRWYGDDVWVGSYLIGHRMFNSGTGHTPLLTYSTVQSPSWEANWFAATQEIPRISRNPKAHYRTHKRPPPISILGQPSPVHIPTSHLLEIHPNIIHPSTPRSPQWSPSLRFPHQDPKHPPLLTHRCYMPSPSHSSRFYHPHNIGWGDRTNTLPTELHSATSGEMLK